MATLAVRSGAPTGRPVASTIVNNTRFAPQASSPGLLMITGRTWGAVAGGPQPARSSPTAGAAGQAAPEAPGEAVLACEAGGEGAPVVHAAIARAAPQAAVASPARRDREREGMATAYRWIAKAGVVRAARIRRRHPEDP